MKPQSHTPPTSCFVTFVSFVAKEKNNNKKGKTMKKLMMIALAACAAGCSVTKIEYVKNDKGEISYRIYRNGHWLKSDADSLRGGMTQDGKFEVNATGLSSSPSEEFNRVMQTYTGAFIQLAQIAAAAYNPSTKGTVTTAAPAAAQQQTDCADGTCTASGCTDGSCAPAAK